MPAPTQVPEPDPTRAAEPAETAPWPALRTPEPLDGETLVRAWRNVCLSRRLDDREIALKRQNRIYFQISGAGHEALLTAAGLVLRPGRDWVISYYRDRALMTWLGMTARDVLLAGVGSREDVTSSGRQMPCHWGHKDLGVISKSSCVGTQFLQAVGVAEAGRYAARVPGTPVQFEADELVLVTTGDGTTSEGEFWEALNSASNLKLPVLFLVEDNGYAISTPVEVGTAGGSVSELVRGFPDLLVLSDVDGCDVEASHRALAQAAAWCRSGRGPALVHAHVVRPYSHSMSDDEANYRPAAEREAEVARDPLTTLADLLVARGLASRERLAMIRAEVDAEIDAATEAALAAPGPAPAEVLDHIYSPTLDPTGPAFDTEAQAPAGEADKTMVDLINACLRDEMARDPRVVVFGQDVADASRPEALAACRGKGGVFKVTHGLQRRFGGDRVFNTPLAEANIVGRAIGMASRGLKPVVEIQFLDYIWPAYQQIRNELATARWRSGGRWPASLVIRTPSGGYLKGGAPYHSQSAETLFTHVPGLRVVMPATALDAAGLLRTAIRCEDPVIFLEPKHLYRQTYNKSAAPGPDFMIPFGRARRLLAGDRMTLLTYGSLVQRSLQAVKLLERAGPVGVDLLDLRTLAPYDWTAIAESVRRTGRALVVHEESRAWGYGAEIAARIGEELFEWLDAPVRRLASLDTFVAYNPGLEDVTLPQVEDVAAAVEALLRY